MKLEKFLILFLTLSTILFAQSAKIELRLPHNLNPFSASESQIYRTTSVDTFRLLAVMVDFAVDQDAATYGNGKFGSHYSKDYGKSIIDPLPHDRNYFKSHLEFLKNYYQKISDGKIIIQYEVLDRIVTLPNVMSYYSPPKSNDLSRLGILFEDVWRKVDSLYPDQDFTKYDVFTIFHAGVGRDIVIPETFGLEKDIPSVYLSPTTLKNFFGANYQGVKIGNPPKYVLNSMILPETESREIQTLTGKALLELSINGLLAASFGSFLGLPDLFDTKTGKTAIGRFGLMDGQAMFAYAGLFPPEPSAWEKYFLGLVEPIEISKDTLDLEVFARLASVNNSKTVYKIPINSREYYLIENRQKDVLNDGIKIKSQIGVNLVEYNFFKDFRNFSSYYVDTVDGVVIDVDEFDWATPGNGILIWHIDEKIIAENFADNSINANPKLRGIKLIEADGIQDIGNEFTTIFGDVVVGEGDSVDFWFKNNPSKFYKNEFSDETKPRTLSNNGTPTYIKIYNFSELNNQMTFSVSFGNEKIKPIVNERIAQSLRTEFIHRNEIDTNKIFIKSGNEFFSYDLLSKSKQIFSNSVQTNILFINFLNGINIYSFVESNSSNELLLSLVYISSDTIWVEQFKLPFTNNVKNLITYPVSQLLSNFVIEILRENGEQYLFKSPQNTFAPTGLIVTDKAIKSAYNGYRTITLTSKYVYFGNTKVEHSLNDLVEMVLIWDNSLAQTPADKEIAVIFDKSGFVETLNEKGIIAHFKIDLTDSSFTIAAGNLKPDETNYIFVNTKDKILAFNKSGAVAENFPIYPPFGTKFIGNLNLIDYNNDGVNDILVSTEDGRLICYNGKKPSENLMDALITYSIGYLSSGSSLIYNFNKTFYLTGNDSGFVQLVQIADEPKIIKWTLNSNNLYHHNVSEIPAGAFYRDEFLPKSKVYNWPNPVYDNETNFRVYVSEDAKIKIKIYDLNGEFVDEINSYALAGIETDIKWNVANIQSGIYFARIEAKSQSKSDYKIIKVAVVK
ncbi:MAG: T9SS type A sorting domain-containing protein [Ignavibacteria bacterium]|nr:T9SS type A sorting domain-containing protein [Ignavibacteria bacterium]